MPKQPLFNTGKEAVALREAAVEWGKHIDEESRDDKDRAGQRRNRALLSAAVKYGRAVDRLNEPPLLVALKKALTWIDAQPPAAKGSPNNPHGLWEEIHDDLITVIQKYDPKWTPGDEPEEN